MKVGLTCQLSSLKTSPGLVSLPGSVQLLHKITNAKTVEAVGINRFKILVTGNIDMWHHPKYYKELRKRNKPAGTGGALCVDPEAGSDQAISETKPTGDGERSPGPGLKQQGSGSSNKQQAEEAQATETQASSSKR